MSTQSGASRLQFPEDDDEALDDDDGVLREGEGEESRDPGEEHAETGVGLDESVKVQ